MSDLTEFQKVLLQNLIKGEEVLRHGHSDPVTDLISKGLVEKKDGIFQATKKAKKLKL